jgi:hypothetical protein
MALFFFAGSCYAEESPAKPACNARTRGKLWPEKAGRHSLAGPIEMCALRLWRYRWEQLTVDVSQLRAESAGSKAAADEHAEAPKTDRNSQD